MPAIEYTLVDKLKNFRKVLYTITYYGIASVLLFSGVTKIIDVNPLIEVLQRIKLPDNLILATATLLPIIEIGLGLILLLKLQQKMALRITAVLFLVFLLFSIYGTVISLDKDCGCFGKTITNEFGWGMIARNSVLLILSIIVLRKD